MQTASPKETVVKNKPVAIRLSPKELEQLTSLAAAEQRTVSNMCRLILSRGLAQHKASLTT